MSKPTNGLDAYIDAMIAGDVDPPMSLDFSSGLKFNPLSTYRQDEAPMNRAARRKRHLQAKRAFKKARRLMPGIRAGYEKRQGAYQLAAQAAPTADVQPEESNGRADD